MQANLENVGGVRYTQEETEFARQVAIRSFLTTPPAIESSNTIKPMKIVEMQEVDPQMWVMSVT